MTPPTWQDWLAIAQDLALHANEEQWQAHAERTARALNEAWSDGRRYQEGVKESRPAVRVWTPPEELPHGLTGIVDTGCTDLLEVE